MNESNENEKNVYIFLIRKVFRVTPWIIFGVMKMVADDDSRNNWKQQQISI